MPDLKDKEVADATLKIQTVFRGFQARKHMKSKTKAQEIDELPNLKDKDVQDAAAKIQASFKGHSLRKEKAKKAQEQVDDLPDLKDKEVQQSAAKIQAAFRLVFKRNLLVYTIYTALLWSAILYFILCTRYNDCS